MKATLSGKWSGDKVVELVNACMKTYKNVKVYATINMFKPVIIIEAEEEKDTHDH